MVVDAQHFRNHNVIVGFRAVPLASDKQPFYSSIRLKAANENTSPIHIGPGSNVTTFGELMGFPLVPGEYIDLEISTPALFAISDDLDQILFLAGL